MSIILRLVVLAVISPLWTLSLLGIFLVSLPVVLFQYALEGKWEPKEVIRIWKPLFNFKWRRG